VFSGIFDQKRLKKVEKRQVTRQRTTKSPGGLKPLYFQAFLIKTGRKTASCRAAYNHCISRHF